MKVSTKSRYGVAAMLDIAQQFGPQLHDAWLVGSMHIAEGERRQVQAAFAES